MSDLSTLKFFKTPAHACSYLEDHQATTLFVDPEARIDARLYSELSLIGFRRSGDYLYRPHCHGCQACIPVRIPVAKFSPKRRHRRILAAADELRLEVEDARFTPALYQLYARYIQARHGDGDMYPPSEEQFASFLMSSWSQTRFLVLYQGQRPVCVAVTDVLTDGLSAVYTFFEPDTACLSPGTLAILRQIEWCRSEGLPYLYLGYYIRNCRKMAYKDNFSPLEAFRDGVWQRLENID